MFGRSYRARTSSIALAALAALAMLFSGLRVKAADIKIDGSLKVHRFDVVSWLSAQQIPAGEEQTFVRYFNDYALLQLIEPANKSDLPKQRAIIGRYFKTARSGPPYEQLTQLTYKRMLDIVKSGQFDNVIKYNAMLVLADLNALEANPVARTPARPLPAVLPLLLRAVNSRVEYSAAALIGIRRHVAAGGISEIDRAQLVKTLLATAAQSQPPQGRSAAGHAWFRRESIDILASLGNLAPDNRVLPTLQGAASQPGAPLFLRSAAAAALGQLRYSGAPKLNYELLAATLGQVALDAGQAEKSLVGRDPSAFPLARRRLMARLQQVLAGFTGPSKKQGIVLAAASSPHKSRVDDLHAKVKACFTAAQESQDVEQFLEQLDPKLKGLAQSLGPAAGGERTAEAASTPERG